MSFKVALSDLKAYTTTIGNEILIGFFVLLFLAQFSSFVGVIAKNVDNESVIASINDDAGMAVQKAIKTRWYNDNGWRAYGPIYYRIVHTIARFAPIPLISEGVESNKERIQKAHHFGLMLVSLLSLYLCVFVLSGFISKDWIARLCSTMIFAAILLSNKDWSKFILVAHPDILYAFFALMATIYTTRLYENLSSFKFKILSAFFWACAASTKLFVVLWVPAFFLIFMPSFNRENVKKTFYYGIWMLGFYWLVGFPQNFTIWKSIEFLLYESQFSGKPSIETVLSWFQILGSQIYLVIPAAIFLTILFRDESSEKTISNKALKRSFLFTLVPFIIMISRNQMSNHNHYTFTFDLVLILYAILITKNIIKIKLNLPYYARYCFIPIFLLTVTKSTIGLTPLAMNKVLTQQLNCRPELRKLHAMVYDFTKAEKVTLISPYVPYPRGGEQEKKYINRSWDHTFDSISLGKTKYVVISKNYAGRYLHGVKPPQWVINDTTDWKKTRLFYQAFTSQEERIRDSYNQIWKKIHEDKCSRVVWERIKDLK